MNEELVLSSMPINEYSLPLFYKTTLKKIVLKYKTIYIFLDALLIFFQIHSSLILLIYFEI